MRIASNWQLLAFFRGMHPDQKYVLDSALIVRINMMCENSRNEKYLSDAAFLMFKTTRDTDYANSETTNIQRPQCDLELQREETHEPNVSMWRMLATHDEDLAQARAVLEVQIHCNDTAHYMEMFRSAAYTGNQLLMQFALKLAVPAQRQPVRAFVLNLDSSRNVYLAHDDGFTIATFLRLYASLIFGTAEPAVLNTLYGHLYAANAYSYTVALELAASLDATATQRENRRDVQIATYGAKITYIKSNSAEHDAFFDYVHSDNTRYVFESVPQPKPKVVETATRCTLV